MGNEAVLSEIGLFVSSRCNFNTSILDHMKERKNNAFVAAVFRCSIMVQWMRKWQNYQFAFREELTVFTQNKQFSQVVKQSVRRAARPQVVLSAESGVVEAPPIQS